MSVICFSSLKGGVGKTSLSINVAHAFAKRGCRTLIIDCDPVAHTTRFFRYGLPQNVIPDNSPLARLFLDKTLQDFSTDRFFEIIESWEDSHKLFVQVREDLHLLPGSAELRYFTPAQGARYFSRMWPELISYCEQEFDLTIVDTPPDFNVITRNVIADADIVAVPVDPSEMSIHCLEELVMNASHIKGPTWAIVRSMVNRQASRVLKLSENHLQQRFDKCAVTDSEIDDEIAAEFEDAESFITLFQKRKLSVPHSSGIEEAESSKDESPIYLLNSLIHRTEQQNRLSFLGKTAFDSRSTVRLSEEYLAVSRELERIITLISEEEPEDENPFVNDSISQSVIAG